MNSTKSVKRMPFMSARASVSDSRRALRTGVRNQDERVEQGLPPFAAGVAPDGARGPAEAHPGVFPDVDRGAVDPDASGPGLGVRHDISSWCPPRGGHAAAVMPTSSRSKRAPRKLPHSRTAPEFTRYTTVATTSASVLALVETACTRSSIVS